MAEIGDLKHLTGMILDMELDVLKRLSEARGQAEAKLSALEERRARLSQEFAKSNGSDEVWTWGRCHLWQDALRAEKTELNLQAARIAETREEQLARARRAFGRDQAVSALRRKMRVSNAGS